MDRENIFPENETVYRANLHCHSTFSDGVMSTEELKALYKSKGYSVLAYTDHHIYRYHKDLADETFLPLAGYELNFDKFNSKHRLVKTCHINAIAIDPEKAIPIEGQGIYEVDVINNAVKRLRENGFVVNLNHPSWSNQGPEEILQFDGFTAIEVYNSCCTRTYNSSENQSHYDSLLKAGKKAFAIAADDNHASCNAFSPFYSGTYSPTVKRLSQESVSKIPSMDCCYGYTMIYAPELSYKAVMDSFIFGKFYCSTGPKILAYYIKDDKICVDCTPVRAIFMKTTAWGLSSSIMDPKGHIMHAEFDLKSLKENDEKFFRLELIDQNGGMAYTNPYYF